ncbi:MAG: cell wall hydrolase [Flammeovirgaceae bacterium]
MLDQHLPYFPFAIPTWYMNINYNPRIIPNGETHDMQATGANCQVFAYALLRYNGKLVPDLRSKELWEDQAYSTLSEKLEPLDILFFKKDHQPWGAHLGVYVGENRVIHLSRKVGKPIVWELEEFALVPAYQVLIGAKRFRDGR